jgi:adenylate cyclase
VTHNQQFWRAIVTGDAGVMPREPRRHRRIPGTPRCKTCFGPDHTRKAVEAAGELLRATADLVPVGAGVHTGVAYVGAVGSDSTVADFTALGDAVNVTARLASVAGAGEALISEAAYTASGSDLGDLERRELSVRGRDAPLAVRVLRA